MWLPLFCGHFCLYKLWMWLPTFCWHFFVHKGWMWLSTFCCSSFIHISSESDSLCFGDISFCNSVECSSNSNFIGTALCRSIKYTRLPNLASTSDLFGIFYPIFVSFIPKLFKKAFAELPQNDLKRVWGRGDFWLLL